LKAIKKAYPNYFLDTNQFIKEMQSAFKKSTSKRLCQGVLDPSFKFQ